MRYFAVVVAICSRKTASLTLGKSKMKVIRCYSQDNGTFLGWLNSYLEPQMSRIGRVVLGAADAENLTGWHIAGVSLVACED